MFLRNFIDKSHNNAKFCLVCYWKGEDQCEGTLGTCPSGGFYGLIFPNRNKNMFLWQLMVFFMVINGTKWQQVTPRRSLRPPCTAVSLPPPPGCLLNPLFAARPLSYSPHDGALAIILGTPLFTLVLFFQIRAWTAVTFSAHWAAPKCPHSVIISNTPLDR